MSDADTQTPHVWDDSGSGSRAGPVALRAQQQQQQQQHTMSALELQKFTGRAVPGVVVNEQHTLWTVVQVAAVAAVSCVFLFPFILHQALKMGVSQCVNRIRTGEKIVPNDSDFLFEHKEQLVVPASMALPQGAAVQWKDYCPFVFR